MPGWLYWCRVTARGQAQKSNVWKSWLVHRTPASNAQSRLSGHAHRETGTICDRDAFEKELSQARTILIIADNAGEVVFDKVLIEYLARSHKVIYAVRANLIINDATVADALKTGIAEYADIISTGCGMPGVVLELCGTSFQQLFQDADMVISKC